MSDNATVLLEFLTQGEERLRQALLNVNQQMKAADQIALKVSKAFQEMAKTEEGAALANRNFAKALSATKKELSALQSAANLSGLERVASNIANTGADLKKLEANAYQASRGFSLLAQTIIRDPVTAFRQLASGAALAESGLTRLGVASRTLNELLSFATVSRFGAIALLYGSFSKAKEGFDLGIQGAKEFDKALAENTRFLVAGGSAAAEATAQIRGLVDEQRNFAMKYAVTVEQQSKVTQMLLSSGIAIEAAKKAYQDFAKVQVAFPEIEMNTFTNSLVGLMNASKNMTGYKLLADDAERLKKLLNEVTAAAAVAVMEPRDLPTLVSHMSAVASAAGLLPEEMLAVAGTLTNLGIKAQSASRLFRGLLVSLSSKEKLTALEDMGVLIEKTRPLGPQLMNILAQMSKIMNMDPSGSTTIKGLEILNEILPAERATIAAALMKDLGNNSEMYRINLEAITNSQGAVERAANEMNKALVNQEIILQNTKKEAATMLIEIVSLGDAYSGLAYLIGVAAVPLSVFALGLKEIGLAASSTVFALKAVEDMKMAVYARDVNAFKNAWENFKLGGEAFVDESVKSYERMEKSINNIFTAAETLRTLNAGTASAERIKTAEHEAESIIRSTKDMNTEILSNQMLSKDRLETLNATIKGMAGINMSAQFNAIKNELSAVLINQLKLTPATKEWDESLRTVLKTIGKVPNFSEKIKKEIDSIVSEFNSKAGMFGSTTQKLASMLETIGDKSGAKQMKEEMLSFAESINTTNLSLEQQIKLKAMQAETLMSLKDTGSYSYSEYKVQDLVKNIFEAEKQKMLKEREDLESFAKMGSKAQGLNESVQRLAKPLDDFMNASSQLPNKFQGARAEVDALRQSIASLAQEISSMPQLNVGGGNPGVSMRDFEKTLEDESRRSPWLPRKIGENSYTD